MKTLGRGSLAWMLWTVLRGLRVLVIVVAFAAGLLALLAAAGYLGLAKFGPWVSVDLESPWQVTALGFLIIAIGLAASYIVIARLQLIFETLSQGDPFVPENAIHLRVIAMVIAAFEVARYVVGGGTALATWLADTEHMIGARIDFNLTVWFAVLVIIVLAEVFREGARMRQEQQLTI